MFQNRFDGSSTRIKAVIQCLDTGFGHRTTSIYQRLQQAPLNMFQTGLAETRVDESCPSIPSHLDYLPNYLPDSVQSQENFHPSAFAQKLFETCSKAGSTESSGG